MKSSRKPSFFNGLSMTFLAEKNAKLCNKYFFFNFTIVMNGLPARQCPPQWSILEQKCAQLAALTDKQTIEKCGNVFFMSGLVN